MEHRYLRSIQRLVPVTSAWNNGAVSAVNVTLAIVPGKGDYLVMMRAEDYTGFGYTKECKKTSLSEAATEFEHLLTEYYHAMPSQLSITWFIENGFSQI